MKRKEVEIDIIKVIKSKPTNPNIRCKGCECDETEHDEYWYCPHFKGEICDVCCLYDSMAPDWNFEECNTCEHDKDRDKTSVNDVSIEEE